MTPTRRQFLVSAACAAAGPPALNFLAVDPGPAPIPAAETPEAILDVTRGFSAVYTQTPALLPDGRTRTVTDISVYAVSDDEHPVPVERWGAFLRKHRDVFDPAPGTVRVSVHTHAKPAERMTVRGRVVAGQYVRFVYTDEQPDPAAPHHATTVTVTGDDGTVLGRLKPKS